jgi:hypothetical protein
VYWKSVYNVLEHDLECKTDLSDAEWICQITEHGLVSAASCGHRRSGVCGLPHLARAPVEERGRQVQCLDKAPQDGVLKLSSVAVTDILGPQCGVLSGWRVRWHASRHPWPAGRARQVVGARCVRDPCAKQRATAVPRCQR